MPCGSHSRAPITSGTADVRSEECADEKRTPSGLVSKWVAGCYGCVSAIRISRLESPTELAVALTGADEADAFECADRRHVLVVATGDDRAPSWLPKGPIDESQGSFGCVPATTPIGMTL